jgi:hypothetical protein
MRFARRRIATRVAWQVILNGQLKMPYSQDEAKEIVYDTFLHRKNGTPLEEMPRIFDNDTIATDWGWVFFYNNEQFFQSRDYRHAWVGPGPVFFNKSTGEIRSFGSGSYLKDEMYDYEMELAANGLIWSLWLTDSQSRKPTILKLKTAFSVST